MNRSKPVSSFLRQAGPAISVAWIVCASGYAMAQEVVHPQEASRAVAAVPQDLEASEWAELRAAYEAARHQAVPAPEGFRARNPGQRWTTSFDGRGFSTAPDSGAWTWGLELVSYGFPGAEQRIEGRAEVAADGERVAYRWDPILEEWYVNDRRGLEHGYTVRERPVGPHDGPLSFTLAVRGKMRAKVSGDGRTARFVDEGGATVLTYAGLVVLDADGESLPARLEAAAGGLRILVEEAGARYPLLVDPVAQEAYLKASNPDAHDRFGLSVAAYGDTVVVGAFAERSAATGVNGDQGDNSASSAGAAYVFVRSATGWSQQAYLKASNTTAGDSFSWSVAISGDTIVVGTPYEDSNATGVNGDQTDNSAFNAGAAYVFVRSGQTWTQQAYLKASNSGATDKFGWSVAIDGDTIVVGAYYEDSAATGVDGDQSDNSATNAGAAYVFVRTGETWAQQAYLKASNTDALDNFGWSVAIAGDTVVVGAQNEGSSATGVNGDQSDDSLTYAGAAYVFVRQGTTWSQEAYLKASDPAAWAFFGRSVAASGDTLVVGSGFQQNSAYVFVRSGSTWSQQARLAPPPSLTVSDFGSPVALDGDVLVVGSPWDPSDSTGVDGDHLALGGWGAAHVFERNAQVWTQRAYLKASNSSGSYFGWGVGISGDVVVVGGPHESGGSSGVNGDQSDQSVTNSGAAYVFDLDAPEPASPFCFGTLAACPCGNPGFAGHGCANSAGPAGGRLDATGSTSIAASSLILIGSNLPPGGFGLYVQGDSQVGGGSGLTFGDGLLCASANVVSIQVRKTNVLGSSSTNVLLPAAVGALAGSTRYYQLWYRDPLGPCGNGFNATNGLEVTWAP